MEKDLAKWLEQDYDQGSKSSTDLDKTIRTIDSFSVPSINEDALFDKIQNNIQNPKAIRKTISMRWISTIAASIIGILVAFTLFFSDTHVATSIGDQVVHTLPDKSVVSLNGNSEITYEDNFNKSRFISLKGEAFFEVQKGSTFTVHTEHGDVTVLGTSFSVLSRGSTFRVSCKTGKVAVKRSDQEIILTPGLRSQLELGKLSTDQVSLISIDSWKNGTSTFENIPLKDVMQSLSSQFNVSFSQLSEAQLKQRFTGSFVHSDMKKALKMVFLPMDISFTVDQDGNVVFE